jgi:hypothetical protein
MGTWVPPSGCRTQQLHPAGDFAVVFIDLGAAAGSQDDKKGIFLSGFVKTCGSVACCTAPAAFEAQVVVRQAIQGLLKVAE